MIANSALTILMPYLTKGGEAISTGIGKDLWEFIKKPFISEKDKIKLEKLKNNPEDADLQAWLKVEMKETLEKNPELVEKLKEILPKAEEDLKKRGLEINISGGKQVRCAIGGDYFENSQE